VAQGVVLGLHVLIDGHRLRHRYVLGMAVGTRHPTGTALLCLAPTAHTRSTYYERSVGSRASRRPSPRKLMLSTVSRIAMPGKIVSQGLEDIVLCASCSMFPHDGVGTWTPRPRKLKEDSAMMAPPTPKVAPTMMGAMALGR